MPAAGQQYYWFTNAILCFLYFSSFIVNVAQEIVANLGTVPSDLDNEQFQTCVTNDIVDIKED